MKPLALILAILGLVVQADRAEARPGPSRSQRRAALKRVVSGYVARKAPVQQSVKNALARGSIQNIDTSRGLRVRGRLFLAGAAVTGVVAEVADRPNQGRIVALMAAIAGVSFVRQARREKRLEWGDALHRAIRQDVIANGARFGREGVPSAIDISRAFVALSRRPSLEVRDQILGQQYGLPNDEIPQGLASDKLDLARQRELGSGDDPWADARAYRRELEAARAASRKDMSSSDRRRALKDQSDFDAVFKAMTASMSAERD